MKSGVIWTTLGLGILWLIAAVFVLPIAIVAGVCIVVFLLGRWLRNLPSVRRAQNRRKAARVYNEICALQTRAAPPAPDHFAQGTLVQLAGAGWCPVAELSGKLAAAARDLYAAEGLAAAPPPPPNGATDMDAARYCDVLLRLRTKLSQPDVTELAQNAITRSQAAFCKKLPPVGLQASDPGQPDPVDHVDDQDDDHHGGPQFTVRLLDVFPNVPSAVEEIVQPFNDQAAVSAGLFAELRTQLDRNRHEMSGVPYTPLNYDTEKLVDPMQHKGAPEDVVRGYLRHTPLEGLFFTDVPFVIPQQTRFEHEVTFAGSGHGKSQKIQFQVAQDLRLVAASKASVVVIDSQGDMIKNIAGLAVFGEGGALHGKLCLIDPSDIEFPVALNLFDVGMDRINKYDRLDRERAMNGILELYDFVLGSLLSAELTQKQSVIFRYIIRLMLQIPGATIHTFRELMEPQGYDKFRHYIDKLEGTARAFFETEFNSKEFVDTKRQVVRRLWGILENQTFERMFSHPKNKLDLFTEMNAGKVILINTAKELLKQNGTEIFGRFFVALIAQVAQERAALPKDARMPTYVYIDEAADYFDDNVGLILEQARKFNVGIVLASQYIGQASQKLQESFAANTSIKFAGGVSDKDARALSRMMRCTPEFIESQSKLHFAVFVRNLTSTAVSLRIPVGHMEAMPRMTAAQFERMRDEMRQRYAVPRTPAPPPTPPDAPPMPPPPVVAPAVDPDGVDTMAAGDW